MNRLLQFEQYAHQRLPKVARDYYSDGACGEFTLKENESAFQRLKLLPRVLRGISELTAETSILGVKIAMPICIAPTAFHKMAHLDGEIATVKAAKRMGTCMTLSTFSTCSLEEVSESAPDCLRRFQLYVVPDRHITKDLVLRAKTAGFKALVITVDTEVVGIKYASTESFTCPQQFGLPNLRYQDGQSPFLNGPYEAAVTWKDIDWIKSLTDLPIVLKGILTAQDAREAVKHGVSGIWVSNHGGRQLDTVPAAIEVLPEIAKAVGNKAEIYVDGGVRYGTDVLKAIALGARAVFIGRPVLWGLTYNGEDGVCQVLHEFKVAMKLSGCASISDINRSLVVHQSHFWSNL
ncbi:LOW QUALITY PROTEIN: 2-Hydroxyacid oxidase 1-like [Corticium candelabrum]|uniref:LOW QUALITY PROTEIN: 2-Hydroxyacid oxidase 1-like n=1 Tax=Corticium candelabrum TaxID=121492 RepID=UPI002E2585CF|nr:LOW QUALITY PROTEIN: 2-Hydroxyacid oxidase 1-like [Corticium candelabrum]